VVESKKAELSGGAVTRHGRPTASPSITRAVRGDMGRWPPRAGGTVGGIRIIPPGSIDSV
jgi:hypothetical protein